MPAGADADRQALLRGESHSPRDVVLTGGNDDDGRVAIWLKSVPHRGASRLLIGAVAPTVDLAIESPHAAEL